MKPITNCRSCHAGDLKEFLDLGKQYLSDFRTDNSKTKKYPLVAVFCDECKLVQLKHTTPQDEMYHDRYGFKSGISDSIKKDLDDIVLNAFQYKNDPNMWLDIASNDGTLLSFVPSSITRFGVDPVSFLCIEAEEKADFIINDYFSAELFDPATKFDVITSISCFYDMPDPNKFVEDVKQVLHPKGVWIIQQNYLLPTMQLSAVDNFCHEHLEYYTLLSLENLLERYGLEVNEVRTSMVNGGSIRTVVSNKGTFEVDKSVGIQRQKELDYCLDDEETYHEFANSVFNELNRLRRFIVEFDADDKDIAILAASTRGATIWQSAGINDSLIKYAVERNPAKVDKFFTAIGTPIVSEAQFRKDLPEYAVIGPWFFADEIIERERQYVEDGGSLIIPLPKVIIVNKNNIDEYLSHLLTNL